MKKYRLVQFHTDTISPMDDSVLSQYYKSIWTKKGYYKPEAFWELPKWAGELSYCLKSAGISHDFQILKQPLSIGANVIFGSVLNVNKYLFERLVDMNPLAMFILGGYTDPILKPNVKWCNSIQEACAILNAPYVYGTNWDLFSGQKCIPRITLSSGCRHKCKFCTIPDVVIPVDTSVINQQVNALRPLYFELVYIDDKTFGQCGNHTYLSDIYDIIKSYNPNFIGFIVQTTALMATRIPLAQLHIYAVEVGVESFNDSILRHMRKPATEIMITRAEKRLTDNGVYYIPNIIVGFQQETKHTYDRTINYLTKSELFHANIYNLAIYADADLNKEIETGNSDDANEGTSYKSYNTKRKNELDSNTILSMARVLLHKHMS